jgi:DNA-binding transcriptional MerR regulator
MDAARCPWTLDELSHRVAEATRRLGVLQHNGQVAEAPNGRTIRWYQSIGLVSRPEQRGRVAFYGVDHLRELVAIKRLQAQGLALGDVQAQLLGLHDDAVRALADVPVDLEVVAVDVAAAPIARRGFWAEDVADVVVDSVPVVVTGGVDEDVPVASAERVAVVDVDAGVSIILPALSRALTSDDRAAMVAAVVATLTARGLRAVPPSTQPAPPPATSTKEGD